MRHWKPTNDAPACASSQVRVSRSDGSEFPVRLRLLGYDECEFEADRRLDRGEQISIHIDRMGKIRARVLSCRRRIVEAEFLKDCPV
ncbi:MAG TPA: hypothetical protein VNS11_07305 [Sphingomicrobium sp.]|nr:hypothetical protein [Sphingomicrobium sp.]